MAKNSIRDYSATNSSNTDIQSIDISEGCSPAGINNAIREVMADLKDVSTGAVALESPAFDSASLTGDLTFGDDNKAIFGAGSDLQIYHDTSSVDSKIVDTGSGNLRIMADNLRLQTAAGTANYATADNGGAFSLYHNGSAKLATTSTGVDVTGSAIMTGTDTFNSAATGSGILLKDSGVTSRQLHIAAPGSVSEAVIGTPNSHHLTFATNNAERMRIDSSGNLLVGTTSSPATLIATASTEGFAYGNGLYQVTSRTGGVTAYFNRLATDGEVVVFRKDGTTVGSIGTSSGYLTIGEGDTGLAFLGVGDDVRPWNMSTNTIRDNAIDLGDPSGRFDDIYATNGTIQTSDANEKQQIAALTDAEITAAKAISALFKTYKWNSAVEAKGDAARTHAGVIAQDVQAAMTAAGLDAGDYAFFISSTWWETQTEVPAVEAVEAVYEDVVIPAVLDEDGNEVEAERTEQRTVTEAVEAQEAYTRTDTYETAEEAPEGATERTRLGIRYPELLAFVGAATEQRLANIETRLAALEAN